MSKREGRFLAAKAVWPLVRAVFDILVIGLGVVAATIVPGADWGSMALIVGGTGLIAMIVGAVGAVDLMISLYKNRDLSAKWPWVRCAGLVFLGCAFVYMLWPIVTGL